MKVWLNDRVATWDSVINGGRCGFEVYLGKKTIKYKYKTNNAGSGFFWHYDSTGNLYLYKCYDAEGISYGGVNYRVSPPDTSNYVCYSVIRNVIGKNKELNFNRVIIPQGKNTIVISALFPSTRVKLIHGNSKIDFNLDSFNSDSCIINFNKFGRDSFDVITENPDRSYRTYLEVKKTKND